MADTPSDRPEFDDPPVVETVLGVQFEILAGFTSGHLGWYWKLYLGEEWRSAAEAPHLESQFERFDGQQGWILPGIQLVLQPPTHTNRLQITNATDDRVIQVQNSRFLYNWRKRGQAYPSYRRTLAEFKAAFAQFCKFTKETGLGELVLNQWEVTYIDHVPRGTLWQTPADWPLILPGLLTRANVPSGLHFESLAEEWRFEIEPRRGRLHIAVQHGQISSEDKEEVLLLRFTARGPVDRATPGWDYESGFDLGYNAILRSFVDVISRQAQESWGRR